MFVTETRAVDGCGSFFRNFPLEGTDNQGERVPAAHAHPDYRIFLAHVEGFEILCHTRGR